MPQTWLGHLLVSMGATSRFHNRVLSSPVIKIVTCHSCYLVHIRCAKTNGTWSKVPHHTCGEGHLLYPRGSPPNSTTPVNQTQYMAHYLVHDIFSNPVMLMSEACIIWLPPRSDIVLAYQSSDEFRWKYGL